MISDLDVELSRPPWLKQFQHVQTVHISKASAAFEKKDLETAKKEYAHALKEYKGAEKLLPAEEPTDDVERYWLTLGTYNYACVLAFWAKDATENREELIDAAFRWLSLACRLGYRNWQDGARCHASGADHMRADTDLEALWTDPRFQKLLGYSEE